MAIAIAFIVLEVSWKKKNVLNMKSDAVWPPGNLGLLGRLAAHGYRGSAPLKGLAVQQSP